MVPVVSGLDWREHGEEFPAGFECGVHFFQGEAEGVDVLEAGD